MLKQGGGIQELAETVLRVVSPHLGEEPVQAICARNATFGISSQQHPILTQMTAPNGKKVTPATLSFEKDGKHRMSSETKVLILSPCGRS
jgi:hypothetical protein